MGGGTSRVMAYGYYINGEFKESQDKLEVINPSTEEVIGYICETPKEDINYAIEKAKEAYILWKKTSFVERAKVLREINRIILENINILAELESQEIGKVYKESLFVDIPLGAEAFNYYASFLETLKEDIFIKEGCLDIVKYEPYGVCAVYLPYNVPLMIFGFTCACALAGGNSLVIKPSEWGSLSILELMKYIRNLDIPKGLINVVCGRGESTGKILSQGEVDLISFTGSYETLRRIVEETSVYPKKIICELGGCNISLILEDALIDCALESVLGSSFIKSGQMCIGTTLLLIQESIYERFMEKLKERVSHIIVGDPFLPQTGMGPLVSKEHLDGVKRKIEELVEKGAKVIFQKKLDFKKGFFLSPTILEVDKIVYEEFFAPVILVKKIKDLQEGERIINDNPTGLVLQVWTQNIEEAKRIADSVNYGTVWINTFAQMSAQTPFGGMKRSGWGRNLGIQGFMEYVQAKHVGITYKGNTPVYGWFG